jgi:3D-(3,5/4)-trihydroxycyclohexane-1,2-dione acylhydrolase (decyclizing)
MVHASVGFARMRNRLQTFACTASIGPGSTNMVTGAALATINRIPVLLLPSDFFATRAANPVLQELEDPRSYDVSVNDAFKPTARNSCRRRCSPRCACSPIPRRPAR